jgi:hypothetical protein
MSKKSAPSKEEQERLLKEFEEQASRPPAPMLPPSV